MKGELDKTIDREIQLKILEELRMIRRLLEANKTGKPLFNAVASNKKEAEVRYRNGWERIRKS